MVAHTCPSDDQLLAFAEGLLGVAQREDVERHLSGCADCSAVVGASCGEPQTSEYTQVGRYAVGEEIGRGGMGRVLRAHDPSLDRDVAIKLVLPTALSASARGRFAREAETLGKLRHPNVLEIFDVGEVEGTPYFVMEFVQGQNLDAWSRGKNPRAVVACLCGAGRGLAAAHANGVLHRDFKPSNVLVGPQGQAKVGDFGLAGLELAATAPVEGVLVDSLTKTGAIMGTLPYMAPELLEGGKASIASDQFAFCVTMHEVLYGVRPFSGGDARALSAAIRRGEFPPAPANVAIPRRARRALVRGLSSQPGDRFPSMGALLDELRPGRGTVKVGVAAVTGLAIAAGAVGLTGTNARECTSFGKQLEAAYGVRARDRIRTAFVASELPYAKASSRSTLEALDTYAEQWVAGSTEACRASERGTLSGDALDLHMRCFRHAEQSLRAMVGLLESPENMHIESGSKIVAGLPNVLLCSDLERLERLTVLPTDAGEAEQAELLGPILGEARARVSVKDLDGAWDLLEQNAAALGAASYPPIVVELHDLRARVYFAREDLDGARASCVLAHELAVEHHLDRDASRTARLLGRIAWFKGNTPEAERWFDLAVALAQAGGFDQVKALTLARASRFYEDHGQLDRAVEAARTSVELIADDSAFPLTSRAEVLLAYGDRLFTRNGGDDGGSQVQEAHRILLSVHGDTHPEIGDVERALQMRASRLGDYEGSLRHGRETLRITLAVDGERSLRAIPALGNFAIALKEAGRYEDAAKSLEQAADVLEDWPEYAPAMRIPVLINLANVMLGLGRNDAARESLTEAGTLLEGRADQRERTVLVDGLMSMVELRDGNLGAARRLATNAVEVSTEVFGKDHFHTADVCTRLGDVELEAQNFELARELLSRALAVEHATEADQAEARFLLARATLEDPAATEADRAAGLALARAAELALTGKPAYARTRDAASAWIVLREPS